MRHFATTLVALALATTAHAQVTDPVRTFGVAADRLTGYAVAAAHSIVAPHDGPAELVDQSVRLMRGKYAANHFQDVFGNARLQYVVNDEAIAVDCTLSSTAYVAALSMHLDPNVESLETNDGQQLLLKYDVDCAREPD